MAVQAQYPSNVLLLNRNGQEMKNNTLGNDYSLQTQTGGLVLDQSHIFFNSNNGGLNPRKRGRETGSSFGVGGNGGSTASTTTTTNLPINLFSLQPQHPQPTLINLSQLHNQQQHNMVSTGLRLAFGEQQQQQQQQQQQNQTHLHSSILSEDVHTQIKQQRDEIDHFLQLQGEHLRRTLAERRQTHYRALLSVAEETAIKRLREKEDEVEKAIRRNNELEQRVAQMRIEAQAWANKARNQETVAASFQAQLQQVMQAQAQAQAQFDNNNNKREEGVGCSGAGGNGGEADDAESAHVDPERVLSSGPSCKACRKRVASVVLLPCRHLCLCTKCNADVDTCPICLSIRSASVEVYLS